MRFVGFNRRARGAGGAVVFGAAALVLSSGPAAQAQPVTPVPCSQAALATAISDAASGAMLSLAPFCTYTLTDSLPAIGTSVTIRGNHATIQRSSAGGTPDFSILTVDDAAALSITQVTLSNGDGEGGAIFDLGGGPLTVTGSTFSDNSEPEGVGGAIYYDGPSRLSVNGCRFIGNSAAGLGGAIFSDGNLVTVAGSEFTDNSAGSEGGAILNDGGMLIVTQTTFTGNQAFDEAIPLVTKAIKIPAGTKAIEPDQIGGGNGGAIFSVGSLTVATSTFADNSASSNHNIPGGTGIKADPIDFAGNGGAIFSVGVMTSTDSTYTGSSASSSGGILARTARTSVVTVGGGNGGAIFDIGQMTVTGGRISMSSATGMGGGVYNDGSASLSHSHVLLNSADEGGGGIFSDAGTVTLVATTVALNDPDNCEPLHTIAGCFF